jgi:hypothetical protein
VISILLWATLTVILLPLPSQESAEGARLAVILNKSADYCQKLDRAALDFVCLEEVTETTRHYTPRTDIYLYDYQFLRKGPEAKEQRRLIAVNGKKTDVRDSALKSVGFQYQNVLFGPVGLLSRSWQDAFDYRLVGEDALHGESLVVVEATLRPGSGAGRPYGRVWIKEDDGSVVKIVWDQRSLGNFQNIEAWAKAQEAEPRITAYSEFGFVKNGLRFPSLSYTQQAYVRKDGPTFVNAEMSVLYKSYQFFTVETAVAYEP